MSPRPPHNIRRDSFVRLGLIQHACAANPEANLRATEDRIREAAARGAHIVVTQELFSSLYFPQTEDPRHFRLAQTIPGPATQRLCTLAKKLKVEIIASLFEKRGAGLYHNSAVVISAAGWIVGRYRKMHIPDDPRFYEKYYFTPGDLGWEVHPTRRAPAGVLVCWDQWYPEAARLTALRGAQILFYPTAIGWYRKESSADRRQQKDAWQTIQRSHAIANGVFVAAVNRVGAEGDLEFWGSSFVCDPGGTVIAEAPADRDCVLIADCDLSLIEKVRHAWPFLRDRRIDAYGDLTKRFVDSAGPQAHRVVTPGRHKRKKGKP